MSDLMTVKQAANWAGIGYDTLLKATSTGLLPCTKRGHSVFVTRADVLDYAHQRALSSDLFDAEWSHFTEVCGMSRAAALDVLAARYQVSRLAFERRVLRRRRDCEVLA